MTLPEFFERGTDLKAAQLAAQRRTKFLFVYLHSPDNWRCNNFVRALEKDSGLLRSLTEQCYMLGVDIDTPAGNAVANGFQASSFPFVAFGVRQKFVATLEGGFTLDRLTEELQAATEIGGGELAKEIAFQAEREERELLRAQQEQALEEAMRIDKARAQQRAAEKAAKEAAEREAREARERAAEEQRQREEEEQRQREEREAKERELELRRALATSSIPEEPGSDVPVEEVGTLKLVAVDGSSVMRRFHSSATVNGLFAVIESLPSFDGEPYSLVTGFPPKPLDREALGETPLKDIRGVWPRSVVTARRVL